MAELTIRIPQLTTRRFLIVTGCGALSCLLAAAAIMYLNRTTGLAAISADQIEGFTPYYFAHDTPPDGYTVDKSGSKYSDGLLQITLTKSANPPVVLTEQALPQGLSAAGLLTNASAVKGAAGPAGVTAVEGRVVGTMLPSGRKTLILVNAPGSVSSGDVTDILKSLRAR